MPQSLELSPTSMLDATKRCCLSLWHCHLLYVWPSTALRVHSVQQNGTRSDIHPPSFCSLRGLAASYPWQSVGSVWRHTHRLSATSQSHARLSGCFGHETLHIPLGLDAPHPTGIRHSTSCRIRLKAYPGFQPWGVVFEVSSCQRHDETLWHAASMSLL